MAAIVKLPSGNWRVQVRRKKPDASNTFRRRADAEAWALEAERTIDNGLDPQAVRPQDVHLPSGIVDLHLRDTQEAGKKIGRSRRAVPDSLKISLGGSGTEEPNRAALIDFGKKRAKAGAWPSTLAIDLFPFCTLLTHAAAVHGIATSPEEVKLARVAINRLGLVGWFNERDRRTTQDEPDQLIQHYEQKPRQLIPAHRIIRLAVATAMGPEEIRKITWDDLDATSRIMTVRDR